jgi:hypothetical protein
MESLRLQIAEIGQRQTPSPDAIRVEVNAAPSQIPFSPHEFMNEFGRMLRDLMQQQHAATERMGGLIHDIYQGYGNLPMALADMNDRHVVTLNTLLEQQQRHATEYITALRTAATERESNAQASLFQVMRQMNTIADRFDNSVQQVRSEALPALPPTSSRLLIHNQAHRGEAIPGRLFNESIDGTTVLDFGSVDFSDGTSRASSVKRTVQGEAVSRGSRDRSAPVATRTPSPEPSNPSQDC